MPSCSARKTILAAGGGVVGNVDILGCPSNIESPCDSKSAPHSRTGETRRYEMRGFTRAPMKKYTVVLMIVWSVGCSDAGEPLAPMPPDIPRAELLAARDTVRADGRHFTLSTFLWRDFMPVSPPDGRPLQGVFYLTATDTARLTVPLSADAVWLVYGDTIWKAWLQKQTMPPGELRPNQICRIVRNGPYWGPDVSVDAIVRVRSGAGVTQLLRAPGQVIFRTD